MYVYYIQYTGNAQKRAVTEGNELPCRKLIGSFAREAGVWKH